MNRLQGLAGHAYTTATFMRSFQLHSSLKSLNHPPGSELIGDTETRRIVNNESSEIIRMLNSEFRGIAGDDTDFYPLPYALRSTGSTNLSENVNNGVYRCGFARSQAAYEAAAAAYAAVPSQLRIMTDKKMGRRKG